VAENVIMKRQFVLTQPETVRMEIFNDNGGSTISTMNSGERITNGNLRLKQIG
jgi:hypothetical protein